MVRWYAEFSVVEPMPNSSQLVFPRMMAPAARSLAIAVASYGGVYCSKYLNVDSIVLASCYHGGSMAGGYPVNSSYGRQRALPCFPAFRVS